MSPRPGRIRQAGYPSAYKNLGRTGLAHFAVFSTGCKTSCKPGSTCVQDPYTLGWQCIENN